MILVQMERDLVGLDGAMGEVRCRGSGWSHTSPEVLTAEEDSGSSPLLALLRSGAEANERRTVRQTVSMRIERNDS